MTILVTGGTNFIRTNFVRDWLLRSGIGHARLERLMQPLEKNGFHQHPMRLLKETNNDEVFE